MGYFIFRRFFSLCPTLFICSLLIFFIVRIIPGDPVDHLLGERGADPQLKTQLMEKWGLDRPWPQQYLFFIKQSLKGDLGHSLVSGQPVWEEFKARFPATVELSVFSLLLALVVGVPLGFLSALKCNSFWDFLGTGISLLGYSMSVFWWGLMLILFFSINLGWTPVSGRVDVLYDITPGTGFMLLDSFFHPDDGVFKSALTHLILPVLTLTTIPLAYITRITRFGFLEIFNADFIRTAKAKGLGFFKIYFVHAFGNVLVPLITVIGLMLGALLAGAVLTETVFSWPGMGRWLVQAVLARDYPVLQGGILLICFMIIIINCCVDIFYLICDPRVRIL